MTRKQYLTREFACLASVWRLFKLSQFAKIRIDDLDGTSDEDKSKTLGEHLLTYYKKDPTNRSLSFHGSIVRAFKGDIILLTISNFLFMVVACPLRSVFLGLLIRDLSSPLIRSDFNSGNATQANNITSYETTTSSPLTTTGTDLSAQITFDFVWFMILSWAMGPLISLMFFWMDYAGMRCRVAVSRLVYEKSLRLNQAIIAGSSSVGEIINLMSNDVARMENVAGAISEFFTIPFSIIVSLGILIYYIGPYSTLACFISILLYMVIQSTLSKGFTSFRSKIGKQTDSRVSLIHEYIGAIQAIKLFTWEEPLKERVEVSRGRELSQIGKSRIFRTIFGTFTITSTYIFVFVAMITQILLNRRLDPQMLFISMELIRSMGVGLTVFFPDALSNFSEFIASSRRIHNFLQLPELDSSDDANSTDPRYQVNFLGNEKEKKSHKALEMIDVSARWTKDGDPIIKNLNMCLQQGELLTIVGRVGSGKTSVLMALLCELPTSKGSINLAGSVSYAPQEAWIFPGSLKENVIFNSPLDESRYAEVIRVCALEPDLEIIPGGDSSILVDQGATLSGGQRARVNLARALYKKADIYMLDDPLSAVDAPVARHLFEKAIQEFLIARGKTVLLATHQLQFLSKTSQVLVLDRNQEIVCGSLKELIESDKFSRLEFARKTIKQALDSQSIDKLNGGKSNEFIEECKTGKEKQKKHESKKFLDRQLSINEQETAKVVQHSPYLCYLKNATNPCTLLAIIIVCFISEFILQFGDYFLSILSERQTQVPIGQESSPLGPLKELTTIQLGYIYTGIILLGLAVTLLRVGSYYMATQVASRNIHRKLLNSVSRAPLSFFDTHSTGELLNRFSRDIGFIDEYIPNIMGELLVIRTVTIIGSLTLTIVIDPMNAIPTGLLVVTVVIITKYTLKTIVRLRQLDNETKSTLYTHLTSTVAGLTTIRVLKAQNLSLGSFSKFQDTNSRASFAYISASFMVGSLLFFSAIVFSTVEISYKVFSFELGSQRASLIGLIIVRLLYGQSVIQWWARLLSFVEGSMVSVSQVEEYCNLNPEEEASSYGQSICEPYSVQKGAIKFEKLTLRYGHDEQPVLNQLNLSIEAGERIGIVGRTGAGKSSLLSVLLRLYPFEGGIFIDGCDTKQMSIKQLRRSISVIPQKPVLFAGTLRYNLDPLCVYQDSELFRALEEVQLGHLFEESTLAFELREGGSNLSVGQRQLLCLARATLSRNKILILDEATANIDAETDALVQQVIREQFAHCTVLTIAHRLLTVLDSNRVLVLEAGRVCEFASPRELARDKNSLFSKMIDGSPSDQATQIRMYLEQNQASDRNVREKLI